MSYGGGSEGEETGPRRRPAGARRPPPRQPDRELDPFDPYQDAPSSRPATRWVQAPPPQEEVTWSDEPDHVQEHLAGDGPEDEWAQPPASDQRSSRGRTSWTAPPEEGQDLGSWGSSDPADRRNLGTRFTPWEMRDIALGTGAMSVAFALTFAGGAVGFLDLLAKDRLHIFWAYLGMAFVAVAAGFVLHELGHKFVAQSYGCGAEFMMNPRGLALALLASIFGFVIAGPGYVNVWGDVDDRQNGKLSVAGPLINFGIAAVAFPAIYTLPVDGLAWQLAFTVAAINVWLGILNMIPIGFGTGGGRLEFDGKKVLRWSAGVWGGVMGLGLLMAFVLYPFAVQSAVCSAGGLRF